MRNAFCCPSPQPWPWRVIAISAGIAGNVLPAWAQDILPPAAPAPPTLGNPANLTATTAGRGEVNVSFSPAAGATVHWVWRVRYDNTDGAYVKGASGGVQTVTGLKPGAGYYFIVIAGRPRATGGGMQWSKWSNWSAAAAGTAAGRTSSIFPANPVNGDYDHDDDHLIEIRSITQLDAMRHDLDGNGVADANSDVDATNAAAAAAYAAAFPNAATGMGCPETGCAGYELAASLDFQTGEDSGAWYSIRGYAADFDGNGLTISNLFINEPNSSNVGLFGLTGTGSTVRRVGLEAANVIGNSSTGGLVGHNSGDIIDSYVKGSVSGNKHVGGLVGYNTGAVAKSYANATVLGRYGDSDYIGGLVGYNPGNINNSYAEGAVSGDDNIGGLVGESLGVIAASYATAIASGYVSVGGLVGYSNHSSITAAYATGAAAGYAQVGGLVGRNEYASIAAAYATGTVSRGDGYSSGGLVNADYGNKTHHSYWDTETSHHTWSDAGLGRTTAQLQTPTSNTGIYSQWDPNQWDFGTSSQYPVLKVEGLSVSAQRGGEDTTTQTGVGATPVPDTTGETGSVATDRAALVELYNLAGGSAWEWGSGCSQWDVDNDNANVNGWCGVTVDSNGRVAKLSLPGANLNNHYRSLKSPLGNWRNLSILGDLAALTHLDLSGNELGGVLPAELDQLTKLTHLNLSGNAFQGDIEDQITGRSRSIQWSNLKNLAELDLSNNRRCEPIAGSTLSTCNHGLSGYIPVGIPYLPNLSVLNLSGNQLTGGATWLLDTGFTGNADAIDATIAIDLSDNPWSKESSPDYWNEFQAEMTRGFVDMAVLLNDKFSDYPKLDAKSVRDYAAGKGLEQIQVRAVKHVAASGKYANAATWIIRGATTVGRASSVVGWVSFTVEGAQIANRMLQAAIDFLEKGPGQVIKNAQNKYLGTRDSCLISNNLHLGDPYSDQAIAACGDNR